ncbi:myeloid-associated differentiation marker homolog [Gouania willdenowi]|uniref:Myeloid-associated differentiation marker homolog n=1 Tax=Gouania willdenowi TaxID=441366 RepID=A0A8C5G5Z8_GOUWI|nr:myeloid-associated differentiation marker homolog [Gouania willdenowi]
MVSLDFRCLTQPVSILRMIVTITTCLCFSLVATVGYVVSPYWAWCMFTWCFCFFFTLLILILEFTTISTKLPFAWDDFTAAFAMLAGLMCLSASVIYPIFFTCDTCHRQIGASVVSWVCFAVYVAEVVLTRLRPKETIGFLSTVPGIMKMLETFIACLVFMSLESGQYSSSSPLQWCVAVYSLCFIFAILIILLTLGQLTTYFPFSFEIPVIAYNALASVMYVTAMVIWPLYTFHNNTRPNTCGHLCTWDKLVVVSIMTILNCIVYILDTIYSIRIVFCVKTE